jgi:hypothetical protein
MLKDEIENKSQLKKNRKQLESTRQTRDTNDETELIMRKPQ